jgi:hypothetical protein
MFKQFIAVLCTAGALTPAAFAGHGGDVSTGDREVIVEWNNLMELTVPNSAGPTLPRGYSMMHIAMFDAINSIEGGYTAYRVKVPAWRYASGEVAAAQAAHDVLVALFPASQASADALLATRVQNANPVRAQLGAQVGKEVAKKILEWRASDGWATPQSYTPPALPGLWQPTPPALSAATFVQAGDSKPFALPTPYYFLPRRPPELDSQEYADAVNEIKAIGGATSTVRTAEQTALARAWAAVNYRQQWSAIWNNVTRDLARSHQLGMLETARLFALMNVSMMDGVHTAQASKFVFQLWRPVHAIQRADEDMNPGTEKDATWMPLLTTPPYPSYAGNMACIGASAATSLKLYFGTNDIPVTASWTGINGNANYSLSYPGLWQMAESQAVSREYGGIHYHFDSTASQEVCPKVASYVYANYMRPK